ncbi:PAAR domain-containing protein [Roseibium aggregatum]|uniref:PAAR domain-containing protein n=1 Tax=Roseibium aggregatum TaxID=187304 RepID=A0A939EKR0_9HYPH|nr:PAAR domain-containing protein [Roseibium aggregatum]MBN9673524.1 PAAR domain-containing protein [Roseibium aggregatum]
MSFPAARLTDMHTCPMCMGVPAPIVWKGAYTVLTGKMPQARVTDMCVCVGPPPPMGGDPIITGAWNVLVEKLPAARLTDLTAKGGAIVTGFPTVLIGMAGGGGGGGAAAGAGGGAGGAGGAAGAGAAAGGAAGGTAAGAGAAAAPPFVTTGLSAEVDEMVNMSPSLSSKLDELFADGWSIETRDGGGSATNHTEKTMFIDTGDGRSAEDQVRSLSHEAGHAAYGEAPYVPTTGLSRDEYVEANSREQSKSEGEATLSNIETRDEILENGGPDIGISGNPDNHAGYESAYEDYERTGDRDTAREEIGDTYLDGETTSTTHESYRDFYERQYGEHYDNTTE